MKLKNEKKALQMFCSNDEAFHKKMTRPFINESYGGKVIASDCYVMLIIDRKLLRCKYQTDKLTIPNQSGKLINKRINFSAIDEAYNQIVLEAEMEAADGKEKECPECNGTGTVDWEYTDWEGEIHYHEFDCPICDGSGEREDYVPVPTGRMLIPHGTAFVMHHTYFDASRVWQAVTGLRLMGFESMTWVGESPQGMNWFEVCDGLTLVIMPILPSHEHQEIEIKLEE